MMELGREEGIIIAPRKVLTKDVRFGLFPRREEDDDDGTLKKVSFKVDLSIRTNDAKEAVLRAAQEAYDMMTEHIHENYEAFLVDGSELP